jgi:hypothetical protein
VRPCGFGQRPAARIVLQAFDDGAATGATHQSQQRLVRARADFLAEAAQITATVRELLSPDQIDLLPDAAQRLLNPRFWRFVSLQDAGEL